MAGDVTQEAAISTAVPVATAPAEPKRSGLYHGRFMTMYILLGVALVATVVGVVLALDVTISPKQVWSAWAPADGSADARATQIAQHTGALYQLPSGNQMLDVIPKKLTVPLVDSSGSTQNVPIAGTVLREKNGKGDKVTVFSPNDSRLFQLCGTGASCAIGEGKASVERGRLVRREALQLALLTFKYVPNVTHVIEFMPPPPGSQPSLVTYYEKQDLRSQLSSPLRMTLTAKTPGVDAMTPSEAAKIDGLTTPHVYTFTFRTTQLGQAVLLLTRSY
jgi:hypothetical protein